VLVRERVLEAEVQAAVRAQGKASLEDVLGVVLETDGSFTVISSGTRREHTALQTVRTPEHIELAGADDFPPDEEQDR
jgi:uncharacterized membrane protein YcaP (DUF421 family)